MLCSSFTFQGYCFVDRNENALYQISLAPVLITFPWHGIMRSKSHPLTTATSRAMALYNSSQQTVV